MCAGAGVVTPPTAEYCTMCVVEQQLTIVECVWLGRSSNSANSYLLSHICGAEVVTPEFCYICVIVQEWGLLYS
jgi:hypothetical protein